MKQSKIKKYYSETFLAHRAMTMMARIWGRRRFIVYLFAFKTMHLRVNVKRVQLFLDRREFIHFSITHIGGMQSRIFGGNASCSISYVYSVASGNRSMAFHPSAQLSNMNDSIRTPTFSLTFRTVFRSSAIQQMSTLLPLFVLSFVQN